MKSLLLLKSPSNAKQYLLAIHKRTFPNGDRRKTEKWREYTNRPTSVLPIKNLHLTNDEFLSEQANKLSFDISRFIEFLMGYNQVEPDIQPLMLHYSIIYLLDFFSRTWLKYKRNWGHGIKFLSNSDNLGVKILGRNGLFQRAVDSFYFMGQSSIFSLDEDEGIRYELNANQEPISPRIGKLKYSEKPEKKLTELIDISEKLKETKGGILKSNEILLDYTILFGMSSISRYRAEEWYEIRQDRDLKNKMDLILYNFLYDWIPELLKLTVIKSGLGKIKSIPTSIQETAGVDITDA